MTSSVAPSGTVMRHPGIPMPFRRTMPDGTLRVFEPGIPVELTSEEMEAVLDDLGLALVVVDIDEKGRPRIDWDLSKSLRDNEKPKAEQAEEGIELSHELMDVLEANAASFVDLSPVGLQQFIDDGGKLESLEGMTPELAQELLDSLATKMPDVSKLVEAGIADDLIEKLVENVKGTDSEWLLDPEQIKAKIADGFRLESLDAIGSVTARKIRKSLGL